MKLYFMKQNAIDFLKANMKNYYMNYVRYNSNEWILDLFDYNPFEFFMEISDFELARIRRPLGETDLDNCKIIYTNMRNISDSQASDERLWAGLCNGAFYNYVRGRWNYAALVSKNPERDASTVVSRFFFSGQGLSGRYRNTLAKYWWTGRETYLQDDTFHWKQLHMIGAEDLASKINEIFYNNTFSSNPGILLGICNALDYFCRHDKKVLVKEHLRPALQYLNAIGGGILLDALSPEDIEAIIKEYIGKLLQGEQGALVFDEESNLAEEDFDKERDDNQNLSLLDIDYIEDQEALEKEVESSDDTEILGAPETVSRGNTVLVLRRPSYSEKTYTIPLDDSKRRLYRVEQLLLGKKVGDVVKVNFETFEIKQIRWT